jgi:PKD repeat protein
LQSCDNPAHTYTTPGTYSVSLAIDGPGGPASVTYTNLIAVYEAVAADFDADPKEGTGPLTVNFNNLSSGDYLTCAWDFGDGGSSSNCDNPSHLYTADGTYTVSLQVNGPGGTGSKTRAGYISVAAAQVSFSATPRSGQLPLLVAFDNLSSGDYDSCLWDFGDGATSSDCVNPSHTYTAPGSYTVELSLNRPSGSDAVRNIDYIVVEKQLINLPLLLRQ